MKMSKSSRRPQTDSDSGIPAESQFESPSSPFSFSWSQHVTRHWWYPSSWSNSSRNRDRDVDGSQYSGQMDREPLTPPSSPASLSGYNDVEAGGFYNRDPQNPENSANNELPSRFKKWKPYKSKKTNFPEYFLK